MHSKTRFTKASSGLGQRISLSFLCSRWREGSPIPSYWKQASFHSHPWKLTNTYRLNLLGCDPNSTDLHLLIILHIPNAKMFDEHSELWFGRFPLKTFSVSNSPPAEFCITNLVQFWVIPGCFFNSLKCLLKRICQVLWVFFKESFLKKAFKGLQGNPLSSQACWTSRCFGLRLSLFGVNRTSGKIREVLLFSSFSAFPKQKLNFYRDEVVIYNTCKKKASTWSFDMPFPYVGKVEVKMRYLSGKERRKEKNLRLLLYLSSDLQTLKLNSKFNLDKETEKIHCREQDCAGSGVDSMT